VNAFLAQRASDEALTRKLARGNAAAFDELYRRYAARLALYGARLLGDRARGEDVAQIALMSAYQSIARGRTPERVRPWLYRIAQNAALEILSRPRERAATAELEQRADEPHDARVTGGELVAALRTLPDRQRRAYVLREVHGLRMTEIAEELGLTAPQVEQALFAARNKLAEVLAFGEALDCETVRALDGGGLDRTERRALRRHLRACEGCRGAVSAGGLSFGVFPFGFVTTLRQSAAGLFGGAAASVAKVGAVVVGAAIVGSVPVAAHALGHGHRKRATPPRIAALAAATVGANASPATLLGAFGNGQLLVRPLKDLFTAPSVGSPLSLARSSARTAPLGQTVRLTEPAPSEFPALDSGDAATSDETSPPPPDESGDTSSTDDSAPGDSSEPDTTTTDETPADPATTDPPPDTVPPDTAPSDTTPVDTTPPDTTPTDTTTTP
jgi:RNA polymerase sigma-70 factor (ECF subfamily)